MSNEVRQDEVRKPVGRNGYNFIGVTKEEGKALFEKGGQVYREEEHRYLVETEDENVIHYGGFADD